MPTWRMKGQYLKNCNCVAFCPCDAHGDPAPHSFCEGVVGMHIQEGDFDGTDLAGLSWAVAFHFPGPLYEGNGQVEAFIDEKADDRQRDAIGQILSGKVGGTWFEIVASVAPNFLGAHFVSIEWEFDKTRRHARVRIPGFLEMTNALIKIKPTGAENRMTVRLPDGVEYKEMEVAHVTMKSTGALKFEWRDTSGGLAEVEHTHEGLVA